MRPKIYVILLLLTTATSAAAQEGGGLPAPDSVPKVEFDGRVVSTAKWPATGRAEKGSRPEKQAFATAVCPSTKRAARAADKTAFVPGDRIGIFAGAATADTSPATIPFGSSMFMYNTPLTSEANGWSYGDPKQWPAGQNLWVYSYYPYDSAVSVRASNGANGTPIITYSVSSNKALQKDLLYTAAPNVAPTDKAIPLPFKHAMAQVKIQVTTQSTPPQGCVFAVKAISLHEVGSNADLHLADGTWGTPYGTTTFTVLPTIPMEVAQYAGSVPQSHEYTDLFEGDCGFFMIPQTPSSSTKIELTVIAYDPILNLPYECSDGSIPEAFPVRYITSEWTAGNVYVYKIELTQTDGIEFDDACGTAPPDPDW